MAMTNGKAEGQCKYGFARVRSRYEGPKDCKKMKENALKTPNMLKDMHINLATMVNNDEERKQVTNRYI